MRKGSVPSNWAETTLGAIGTTMIGLTYSPSDVAENGIPVLRSGNIQDGTLDLDDLVRVKKTIKPNLLVQPGDILICARNGSKALVGKSARIISIPEGMAFGAFMAIYRSQFNDYVQWFLQSPLFRRRLNGVGTATINQLTQNNLKSTPLPLPPREEQKRIVSKIESCFSRIAAIQSTVSSFEAKLRLFALSFLRSSVHWDGTYQSLGELYEERVDRLGQKEVANLRRIGVSNETGVVDLRSEQVADTAKYKWVQQGDLFYNPMRLNVGSIALYEGPVPALTSPDYVVFKSKGIGSTQLLFQFLKSEGGLSEIKKRTKGSVRERVYFESLSKVSLPKLTEEGHDLCERMLKGLRSQLFELQRANDLLVMLKSSILEKAFSGKLVAQIESEGTGRDLLTQFKCAQEVATPARCRKRKAKAVHDE